MGRTSDHTVEILPVGDNPSDVEMSLSALRKANVANNVHIARGGEQVWDYISGAPGTAA